MLYASGSLLWLLLIRPDIVPPYFSGLFRAVVVDAGHGGKDRGAAGNGLIEKELTLDVAERVGRQLREHGLQVVMTRETDDYLSLAERVRVGADQRVPAIFLSIHFNYAKNRSAQGVETFYYNVNEEVPAEILGDALLQAPPMSDSEVFAQEMQRELVDALGVPDRGVKNRGFFVLRHSRIPAVLVEGGFVTNAREAARLNDPKYRQRIADAIEDGVQAYRNVMRQRMNDLRRKEPS